MPGPNVQGNRKNIIQWNIDGFFSHLESFKLLVNKYLPYAICIQETKFNFNFVPEFKNYKNYYKNFQSELYAKRGLLTLVDDNFFSEEVVLNTNLEALAVKIFTPLEFTLCNLYLPGDSVVSISQMSNLIKQLGKNFMICVDANSYNLLWGSKHTNARGRIIEEILNKFN